MEEDLDLVEMVKFFLSKKFWIIVVGVICVVSAILYNNFAITPVYSAKAKFILTKNDFETDADVEAYAKLPDRYFAIANSRTVLDKVIKNLKLDMNASTLKSCINITHSPELYLTMVEVTVDDAKKAKDIANEMVKMIIEEIKIFYNDEDIQILEYAVENNEPINVNLNGIIVKFVVVGEGVVCAGILMYYIYIGGRKKNNIKELEEKK